MDQQNIYCPDLLPLDSETEDEWIWRVFQLKEQGKLHVKNREILEAFSCAFPNRNYSDDTTIRKRYAAMKRNASVESTFLYPEPENDYLSAVTSAVIENEKQRIRVKKNITGLRKDIRDSSSLDEFVDNLCLSQEKYPIKTLAVTAAASSDLALYVLLSDLHIGLSINTPFEHFNSEVAEARLSSYASQVIASAHRQKISVCYVSLLGDMISGNIHITTRMENELDLCDQIMKSAQLVSAFLHTLSSYFQVVYINAVPGNHSRPDPDLKNNLRSERLDRIVYELVRAHFHENSNLLFIEDEIDPTVANFTILGKNFIAVHGDMDRSAVNLSTYVTNTAGIQMDYMVMGHLHHIEAGYLGRIGSFMSGSLCGTGDDYTSKKRIYGTASQLFLTVSNQGVVSIHPVFFGSEKLTKVLPENS